jgi:hypothetical protein
MRKGTPWNVWFVEMMRRRMFDRQEWHDGWFRAPHTPMTAEGAD